MAVFLLGMATGCTSTVTLGPKANKDTCLNVSAGWKHVGVTLPFVQASSKLDTGKQAFIVLVQPYATAQGFFIDRQVEEESAIYDFYAIDL